MIFFFKKYRTRGASIRCGRRETRRTPPANQGSSRRYPSRDRGVRRDEGSGSCLAPLTECCDQMWRCNHCVPVPYDSFPCHISIFLFESTLIIYSLLFTFIFFHLHNFFLPKHKILKVKKIQLKNLKFLKFKSSQNFKFSPSNTL